MGRIGGGELLLIALIAILLFGASRLSDIGKGLGEGIKNFKKGLKDESADDEKKPAEPKPAEDKPADEAKKS
jgi:sec-independent protein translocase protein TatA